MRTWIGLGFVFVLCGCGTAQPIVGPLLSTGYTNTSGAHQFFDKDTFEKIDLPTLLDPERKRQQLDVGSSDLERAFRAFHMYGSNPEDASDDGSLRQASIELRSKPGSAFRDQQAAKDAELRHLSLKARVLRPTTDAEILKLNDFRSAVQKYRAEYEGVEGKFELPRSSLSLARLAVIRNAISSHSKALE